MAMSEPGSNPIDWLQFYQRTMLAGQVANPRSSSIFAGIPAVSESVVVTTNTSTTTTPTPSPGVFNNAGGTSPHLNIEGRVGKSTRRRSRASRRAPTTTLNTDTTNFRAMVQQFTGVPTAPFSSSSFPAPGSTMSFGYGAHLRHQPMMVPPSRSYFQQEQQQQKQQLPGRGEPMFSLGNNNEGFLPVFRIPGSNLETSDGFLETISSQMLLPGQTASDNNNNNTQDYIL